MGDVIRHPATGKAEKIKRKVEERVMAEADGLVKKNGGGGGSEITPSFIRKCLGLNNLGDGELFKRAMTGHFLYNNILECWMEWTGHHWDVDNMARSLAAVERVAELYEAEAKKAIGQMKDLDDSAKGHKKDLKELADAYNDRARGLRGPVRRANCLLMARTTDNPMAISGDEIDRNPWLLACPNGVINLQTGDFRDGKPEDYLLKYCPTVWKGIEEPCPIWDTSMLEIYDGDNLTVEYLQRLFGMACIGAVYEHVFPVMIGPGGRNGKSTIIETITHILGDLAGPIPPEMLLGGYKSNPSAPSPEIMDLKGRRIVWASETEEGAKINKSKVKWVTGGERLKGRYLQSNMCEFEPTHTLFFISNFKPQADSNDKAFWARMQVIPHNVRFVKNPNSENENERPADIFLKEKLREEASGILAWLVRGCLKWYHHGGLRPSPRIIDATGEYEDEEDNYSSFVGFLCERDNNREVGATDLYDAYYLWHKKYVSQYPPKQKRFGQNMRMRFRSEKIGGNYRYFGLDLRHNWMDILGFVPGEKRS